jgi:hypothetical protein
MTDEKINIAIAESLGFMRDEISDCWRKDGVCFFIEDPHHLKQLPNYTSDLNACHDMIRHLTDDEYAKYSQLLLRLAGSFMRPRYHDATARQRCEAFLKTLNLWIE